MPNTTPTAKKIVVTVKAVFEAGDVPSGLLDALTGHGFVRTRAVTRSGVPTQTDTQFVFRAHAESKRDARNTAKHYIDFLAMLYTQGDIESGFVHSYILGGKTKHLRLLDVDFGRTCTNVDTDCD